MFCALESFIEKAVGISTLLVRAPYGRRSLLLQYLSLREQAIAFHWSHHFSDWTRLHFNLVEAELPRAIQPGAILLLHDGIAPAAQYRDRKQTLILTELILNHCETRGLCLRTLGDEFPDRHKLL